MFGAIYKNTQIHLLKDTLVSFGLSLIYPFGIYLLPGLFRIPALSNRKNKKKYLYDFNSMTTKIRTSNMLINTTFIIFEISIYIEGTFN